MKGVADERREEEEEAGGHRDPAVLGGVAEEGGEEEEGANCCEAEAGEVEGGVVEDFVVVPECGLVNKEVTYSERQKNCCVSKDCLVSNFPHRLKVFIGVQR